jgi:hypothetical protein
MAYLPVSIAGGTYRHTDLSLTAQRTINFNPQLQDAGNEKSPYTIESFYGLKAFSSNTGLHRGSFAHQGVGYILLGTTLSSFDDAGALTTLGTILGDGRAVFDGLGSIIIITANSVAYTWDGTTFTTATDPDFESPNTVTVINSQAVYDGNDGRFGVSDVGLPLTINALNYATAESKADTLLRPFAFGTNVYMFGSEAIEQWWNSGNGNPPFDRIEGGLINIGLRSVHSVAADDDGVFFFGDDDQVYYLLGGVPTPLLPKVIVREISKFTTTTDAVGWTMQLDGQWYYVLKFSSADRTFIFPKGGQWFELSSGLDGGRYNGDGHLFVYGKHLVPDEEGNILELDIDTLTDNGETIRRVRTLSPIHAGLFGKPGKSLEISYLKLIGKTGTGLVSGQGENPQIILQYSQDGENFGTEIWADVGKMGVETELIFEIGESFETWIFRLVSTDPVYSNWHSAAIEVEIGI